MGCSLFLMSNKKKRSCLLESSNMGSACEVDSIEDILIAILVLLPATSIFRFRCVSKRWNTIILTPFFLKAYYSIKKARSRQMISFIQETHAETGNIFRTRAESMAVCQMPHGPKIIDTRNLSGWYFVNSSGGLILLKIGRNKYLVVNPITNKRITVTRPRPPKFHRRVPAVALVCEENINELVARYKVVVFGKDSESSRYIIQIFCSKTLEWTTSTPIMTGSLDNELQRFASNPFVVDGIIHWITIKHSYLVIFDLKISTYGSNSNSSTSIIQLVELPSRCRRIYCLKVARSSRDDDFWLCLHMRGICNIKIWMMRRDEYDSYKVRLTNIPSNAWHLMHEISYLAPAPTPTSSSGKEEEEEEETTQEKWAYNLKSRGPDPCKVPYLAFLKEEKGSLRIWNLADMSFELTPPYRIPSRFARSSCDYFPCMEALSLSSYAL